MVTSLEEVIQLNVLPMREDSENYGRVTLAMVYMLYAEIVMYQNDDSRYSTALKYMEEIISSPQYDLMPDYTDIFKETGEWSIESIFEINYKDDNAVRDWGSPLVAGGTALPTLISPYIWPNGTDNHDRGWGFCPVRKETYERYSNNDTRRNATCWNAQAVLDAHNAEHPGDKLSYTTRYQDTGFFLEKYAAITGNNKDQKSSSELNWNNNLRIYRYSETLLNAAELITRGAGQGDAKKYLNLVHKRAGLVTEIEPTLDNIIEERHLEFVGEGKRYWDLIDILNVECKINDYILKATGSKMKFDGYTKIYNFTEREDKILPPINEGDTLIVKDILPLQHFTQPPARYTEASLVKTLEELGIGRPSTYAPTITTILNREYVEKQGSSLHPTELGKIVTDILETNFQKFIDVDFTATMESQLDEVEEGNIPWKEVVAKSYEPLKEAIEIAKENIEKINMDEETDEICENCGEHMVIKHGRFGKFMACKNYPECKTTKPIVNKIGVKCPKCNNGDIILRKSKKGKAFYGCSNYPECDFLSWNKPTGDICDKCGSYMVEKITKSETKVVCPNKECKNEMVKENSEN